MTTALVTGALGQDGRYLCELLVREGARVVGAVRDPSRPAPPGVELVAWDMRDGRAMTDTLRAVKPAEVYNLAAYSSGAGMWDDPVAIGEVNGLAVARLLEAIRAADPAIRFAQAGSSELFGRADRSPQNEDTPMRPRSPYGAAKLYAHTMVRLAREGGMFACSAILFNHESPWRRPEFVTRKVTRAAARIALGLERTVTVGDLATRRDWSFAGDSMRAMRLMLQADAPDDYVIASGATRSIGELCRLAFAHVGLDWRDHVREDRAAAHTQEPVELRGDHARAIAKLGWRPEVQFAELVAMMVDADLRLARMETVSA